MLSSGGATVRFSGSAFRAGFDDDETLSDALRRVGSIKNEAEQVVNGLLSGLLPQDRRFEFAPEGGKEILKGIVPPEVFKRIGELLIAGLRSRGQATLLVRSFEQPWSDEPRRTYQLLDFKVS